MTAWSNQARTRFPRKRHCRKTRARLAPQMRTVAGMLSEAESFRPQTENHGVFDSVSVRNQPLKPGRTPAPSCGMLCGKQGGGAMMVENPNAKSIWTTIEID